MLSVILHNKEKSLYNGLFPPYRDIFSAISDRYAVYFIKLTEPFAKKHNQLRFVREIFFRLSAISLSIIRQVLLSYICPGVLQSTGHIPRIYASSQTEEI